MSGAEGVRGFEPSEPLRDIGSIPLKLCSRGEISSDDVNPPVVDDEGSVPPELGRVALGRWSEAGRSERKRR